MKRRDPFFVRYRAQIDLAICWFVIVASTITVFVATAFPALRAN